jgi:peptide/nickel transport system permease protein
MRVASHVFRRLSFACALLLVVSSLVFVLLSLSPGDPTTSLLPVTASRQQHLYLRHQLGLDVPVWQQYWTWLGRAVHGDLGRSLFTRESVSQSIEQRVPATASLIVLSLAVIVGFGVVLGVLSARFQGARGRVVDGFALIGFALPSYWLAVMTVGVFAVRLRWLPAVGYASLSHSPGEWLRSLLLPVLALALGAIAGIAKNTREAMVDALASEHVKMARASGISGRRILFVYALRNASIRVVTVSGLLAIGLLGGTVFVEQVFALPGLGALLYSATNNHDYPVVEGVSVVFSLLIIIINIVVDAIYAILDPRIGSADG